MESSLSNLVNNLSEGLDRINVNYDVMIKNLKHLELNLSIPTVFLNT